MVTGTFLEMVWSHHELKNPCFERVKNAFFTFLQIFEWESWNHTLRSEAKPSKQFKSKFGHRNLLRKWFWSYLEPKNECCERLNRTVLSLCKFLSDEVETVSWESETKYWKLFKSESGHSNLLRKWFWSYLQLKKECS